MNETTKIIIAILLWLLFLVLISITIVRAETYNEGSCQNVTIGNYTTEVCCEACWCNVTNITIELNLDAGETVTGNEGICYYDISAGECESSEQAICKVDRNMKPGETYIRNSGACDIDFSCKVPDDCVMNITNETFEVPVEFEFIKQGETLKIIKGDEQLLRIDGVPTNYNFPFTHTIQCPSLGYLDSYDELEVAAICEDYVDNIDGHLLLESYNNMLDSNENMFVYAKGESASNIECLSDLKAKGEQLTKCNTENGLCENNLKNKTVEYSRLKDSLNVCNNSLSNRGVLSIIFIILFFVSLFVNGVLGLLILHYKGIFTRGKL